MSDTNTGGSEELNAETAAEFVNAATLDINTDGTPNLDAFLAKYETDAFAEEAKSYLEAAPDEVVADAPVQDEKPNVEENKYAEAEARLLAREEAVRKSEAAIEDKIKEAVARRYDFRGKRAEEVLTALGFDPELAMKEMMYERASDTNPVKAKLREELRDVHTRRELDSMRTELETARAVEAQRAYFQQVENGAREYVTTKVDEKVTPIFAQVAKTKPELAHQRVMQVILEDARERLARGEDGDPLSYSEAVKRAEAGWTDLAGVFKAGNPVVSPTVPQDKKEAAVAKRPVVTTKPIVKPVADMTPDEIVKAGIEKATKTFYVEEAKARGITK